MYSTLSRLWIIRSNFGHRREAKSIHGSQFFNVRQSTNNFYLCELKMVKKLVETFLVKTVLQYYKFHSRASPALIPKTFCMFLIIGN